MMARAAGRALGWWAARRRRALERARRRPAGVQEERLLELVTGRVTPSSDSRTGSREFARWRSTRSGCPCATTGAFQPLWERAVWGVRDVDAAGGGAPLGARSPARRPATSYPGHPGGAGRASPGWLGRLLSRWSAWARSRCWAGPCCSWGVARACIAWASAGSWATSRGSRCGGFRRFRGRYAPGPAVGDPDWETRDRGDRGGGRAAGHPSLAACLVDARPVRAGRSAPAGSGPAHTLTCSTAGRPRTPHRRWRVVRILRGRLRGAAGAALERLEVYLARKAGSAIQTERARRPHAHARSRLLLRVRPVEDLESCAAAPHTVADVELGRPYAVALSTRAVSGRTCSATRALHRARSAPPTHHRAAPAIS